MYWRGVDLVMRQFDGMVDGFEDRRQHEQGQGADGVQLPELGKDGFLFTNGNGESAEKVKKRALTAQLSVAVVKQDLRAANRQR